ncbi:hypothetical protein K1X84_11390 [bacterium]|nr:hypothetical protein [bacterium]
MFSKILRPWLLMILVFWMAALSSVFALDPSKSIAQYSHNTWQTDEGLPQNTIYCILQTHDGFLWLGTHEGLVRFNGLTFTIFDRTNTKEILSNQILALFEDKQHNLWIGTGNGLLSMKNGRFKRYSTKEGLPHDVVSAIAQDTSGNVWAGTNAGLGAFDGEKFTVYTKKEGLSNDFIKALCLDRQGRLWIGTNGGGLNLFKDGKFRSYTVKDGMSGVFVSALHEGPKGDLWIGTLGGGVTRLKNGKFSHYTTYNGLTSNEVWTVHEDAVGSVWIGTALGLNRLRDERVAKYTSADGLTKDVVLAIFADREQSLWVGTYGGGLNRFKDRRFVTFTSDQGLSNDYVRSVCESRDGSLWISTDGGGVNQLKNGKVKVYSTKNGLSNDFVRSVFADRQGNVWIGTNGGGLNRIQNGRITKYSTKNGLTNNDILVLNEDRAGGVWIGTNGGGVMRFYKNSFNAYSVKDGLGSDIVTSILQDHTDQLWFGTNGGGVTAYKDGKAKTFTTDDGLLSNDILTIFEDSRNTIWVGTSGGGIARLDDDEFVSYTVAQGLFNDIVFQILEDDQGYLWMTCSRGVFKIALKDFDQLDKKEIATLRYIAYGKSDDMKSSECTGGSQPAGWKMKNGMLCFPTIKGIAMIEPKVIKTNMEPPPVAIENIIADNETVELGDEIEIGPGTEKFEFHYAGLSYFAPEKVRFKYMLEGFDDEWVDADTRRTAYYTNIFPGEYTFKVIACNNDGMWNEAGLSLPFYFKPFFYQTWWFYSLCVIGLIAAGFGGYKWRVRQLIEHEKELTRLVDERTRDLKLERDKSERLLLNILPEPIAERLKTQEETIADSFAEVTVLFADIVDFTKLSARISPEELVGFLNDVFSAFDGLVEKHQLEKIKTIGDAYMIVSGLPNPRPDHALAMANMALDMQNELNKLNQAKNTSVQVRIGINTGPVVAGVIGKKKFIYDLWGDAVNTASRMESHGVPGCIQVTESTYTALKDQFKFEKRGMVTIKGKGDMMTYLLQERK